MKKQIDYHENVVRRAKVWISASGVKGVHNAERDLITAVKMLCEYEKKCRKSMSFKYAIEKLQKDGSATITPHGKSMKGRVEDGDTVHLEKCGIEDLKIGDIVLVKVKGKIYLHLIKALKQESNNTKYLIGNNIGGTNGWVGANAIYGKASKIERGKK